LENPPKTTSLSPTKDIECPVIGGIVYWSNSFLVQ
jgi:hypothetical protein